MDTFGEWLRGQRNRLRLTREQFAQRVGCSVALIRKIESDERRPSIQIAELMANCLAIPSSDHATFVKAARGELSVERLFPVSNSLAGPGISPALLIARIDLPTPLTSLIGRQSEVAELGQLLRDPTCRLLTLVGPGGIGKTRLAIEAASQARTVFADGVYFVPLASVNATRFIVPLIADAMRFVFSSSNIADPQAQLFRYLKEKQVLLLLDNLEHLLTGPGIEVLVELLANAPQVKLLATSRECLRLQGEWLFDVQGLPVPESQCAKDDAENTSVELFLQRARQASVRFSATAEDYPAIVRICQLVEGTPLGIELAATWVRTLSCREIALEIEHGLDFLSASTRDLPARHRSMRAVCDHSWELLSAEEQEVLLRLSVFRGGFQREAAEQVAGAKLIVLSALMMKSLIRQSGDDRFDLHELIRQFAAERFSECPEKQVATQARHGNYYLMFFSQAGERLWSSEQREVLAELTAEMDNFRTAWDWAIIRGEFTLIEQTLDTFEVLYDMRGWLQEGFDTLGGALIALETARGQSPPERADQVTLGHLLIARAVLVSRLGRHEQAQAMLERSLEILRPLNERHVLVEALTFLASVMELTSNYARALELYSEGLEMATAIGDRWFATCCTISITELVGITHIIVELEKTYARLQSAVADCRAIGDPRLIVLGLNNLGLSALRLRRYDEARVSLEEAVALSQSIGDRLGLGYAYRGIGLIAQAQGEHVQALDLFRKSLETLTELGARQDVARVLSQMSRSIFAQGNDAEAGRLWREALRLAMETRGMFIALDASIGIARIQAKQGKIEQAFELLLIILDHPAGIQSTKDRATCLRVDLEAQLTGQQVEAARTRAQSKTFEATVEEVLRQCL